MYMLGTTQMAKLRFGLRLVQMMPKPIKFVDFALGPDLAFNHETSIPSGQFRF